MKQITLGTNIYKAFKLVENFSNEVKALAELMTSKINDHVFDENRDSIGYKIMGKWRWYYLSSDYDWILKQYWCVLPLSNNKKARTKTSHHLFVFFDIAGDESSFDKIGNTEPLLNIWLTYGYEGDGVFSIDPDEISKWEDWQWKSNVLGCVKSEFDGNYLNEWMFTLRLTSINSPEDIDKKVINPLLSLLLNKYDDAIKYLENIDGIVRFVADNNNSFSLVHSGADDVIA
jgi:hypothetical protein